MIKQSNGKIFLADERGINESTWFRSFNTFNFGKYYNEHKHSFAGIYVFNDDTLNSGRTLNMLVEERTFIVLLPVIGAVDYRDSLGNSNLVAAGQAQVAFLDRGASIQISNPFKEELVNFLQIWIRADNVNEQVATRLFTYEDVNSYINTCIPMFPSVTEKPLLSCSIGKFSGRGEAIYCPGNEKAGLFVFVIEGAFEVEGRLLHARDGLALWDINEIEMEALSNDAIVLVVESPFTFSRL